MHAIWSGSLSFGLVNIPVKIYSGAHSDNLDLDMLRKSDLCPVKYLRVCEEDGKEIPYNEIVKGYEYTDGEYVVLTDKDFENASVEKTRAIEILDFVDESEIDSRLYEKPYYLEPDKAGSKSYALIREALTRTGKVGIAQFVLRNRGKIGVVKPYDNMIVLNQIRYNDEINNFKGLNLPEAKNLKEKEIELALTLIDQLTTKFKPAKYKDTYIEDLKKIISQKSHGKKPKAKGKEPKPTKVYDIMDMLKKSINQKKKKAA